MSHPVLYRVSSHWAIQSLDPVVRQRAPELAKEYQRTHRSIPETPEEVDEGAESARMLLMAGFAYELAATDHIDYLVSPFWSEEHQEEREVARFAAHLAFGMLSALPLPSEDRERMLRVLHVAALGVTGNRREEVRQWLARHKSAIQFPLFETMDWEERLFTRIYQSWLDFFGAESEQAVDAVPGRIALLRAEQPHYEAQYLEVLPKESMRSAAFRLLGLQHLARVTESVATFWVVGKPPKIASEINQHLQASRTTVARSGDVLLENLLPWLAASAHILIRESGHPVEG